MASVKTGQDSLGRQWKTVDGRHVAVTAKESPRGRVAKNQEPNKTAFQKTYGIRDPINKLMYRYLKGADSPSIIKKDISNLIATKFKLWFTVSAQTSVGKYGRLYAARKMLEALNGEKKLNDKDVKLLKGMVKDGQFDSHGFLKELEGRGVTVNQDQDPGDEDAGNQDSSDVNDQDGEILALVHGYGLDAKELSQILRRYTRSNHDTKVDSEGDE